MERPASFASKRRENIKLGDEHTRDGIHADEIAYLVVTDSMLSEGQILRSRLDAAALATLTERVVQNGEHLDQGRILR